MKYKNVIIDDAKKIIYHRVAVEHNKKVKIIETKEENDKERLQISGKYKKLKTILLISYEKLLFRQLQIPKVSDSALYNTAKFALEEYYPGENIRNYTIGFYITHSDSKMVNLLVWGIKKSLLESLLKKYCDFNIEYIIPAFILSVYTLESLKRKNAVALFFIIPNNLILLRYKDYLTKVIVKLLPNCFYSYKELQNMIDEQLIQAIKNLLKFSADMTDNSGAQIYLFPEVPRILEKMKEDGTEIISSSPATTTDYMNLEGVAYLSEKENLLKEEFKKTEVFVRFLSHILFLLIIMLFTVAPMYFVKMADYQKNYNSTIEIKKEFVNLYKEITGDKWENFQKSYQQIKEKVSRLENSIAISKDFPLKFSALKVINDIFNIPEIKEVNLSNFFINILQKKCSLKATTRNQQIIEVIIRALNGSGYNAQLSGSVVVKENNLFEFEILIKWEN
ncbi:MAG: hypothetical protein ACK4NF_00075 [Planctomycetota bacterium]